MFIKSCLINLAFVGFACMAMADTSSPLLTSKWNIVQDDNNFSTQLHPNILIQKDRHTYEFQYNQFLNNLLLNGLKARLQARLIPEQFTVLVVQDSGVRIDTCDNVIYAGYESTDDLTNFLANRFPLQESARGRDLFQLISAINSSTREKLQYLQRQIGVQITYDLNDGICLGPNYFNRSKLLLGLINIEREIHRRNRHGEPIPREFSLIDGFWSLPGAIDVLRLQEKFIRKNPNTYYLRYDDMLTNEDNMTFDRIVETTNPSKDLVSTKPHLSFSDHY